MSFHLGTDHPILPEHRRRVTWLRLLVARTDGVVPCRNVPKSLDRAELGREEAVTREHERPTDPRDRSGASPGSLEDLELR